MCGIFGGGGPSASEQAAQAMAQQQANLRATQAISPAPPLRSDEQNRRATIASIAAARAGTGYSSTVLSGGLGPVGYGNSGRATLG